MEVSGVKLHCEQFGLSEQQTPVFGQRRLAGMTPEDTQDIQQCWQCSTIDPSVNLDLPRSLRSRFPAPVSGCRGSYKSVRGIAAVWGVVGIGDCMLIDAKMLY